MSDEYALVVEVPVDFAALAALVAPRKLCADIRDSSRPSFEWATEHAQDVDAALARLWDACPSDRVLLDLAVCVCLDIDSAIDAVEDRVVSHTPLAPTPNGRAASAV